MWLLYTLSVCTEVVALYMYHKHKNVWYIMWWNKTKWFSKSKLGDDAKTTKAYERELGGVCVCVYARVCACGHLCVSEGKCEDSLKWSSKRDSGQMRRMCLTSPSTSYLIRLWALWVTGTAMVIRQLISYLTIAPYHPPTIKYPFTYLLRQRDG